MKKYNILIFYRDLRVQDNLAFKAALESGMPCLALYVFDDSKKTGHQYGSSQKGWLVKSLQDLEQSLKIFRVSLVFRKGSFKSVVKKIFKECGIPNKIFLNDTYDKVSSIRKRDLDSLDCSYEIFPGALLFNLDDIQTGAGSPYKVFTPFWRACLKEEPSYKISYKPKNVTLPKCKKISSDAFPKTEGSNNGWVIGELEAQKQLKKFTRGFLLDYPERRDFPFIEETSMLSPHLAFGEISPHRIWQSVNSWADRQGSSKAFSAAEKFLSELGWREFSYYLLKHFPYIDSAPFITKFNNFPWEENKNAFQAWTKGLTGYPIIDAGMRQLQEMHWMHNRVRMLVASFLLKDLFLHWKDGEAWFWNYLADADPAINVASWQWVAGSGADAAPYFRIFNPETQSKKFDVDGEYIRKWVPELEKLPSQYIHAPMKAPEAVLKDAGIKLGKTYPLPIVDHSKMREKALNLYKNL